LHVARDARDKEPDTERVDPIPYGLVVCDNSTVPSFMELIIHLQKDLQNNQEFTKVPEGELFVALDVYGIHDQVLLDQARVQEFEDVCHSTE
jgi:hypothetical protein